MNITTKYDIGSLVYLVTDSEQLDRMITGIKINPSGLVYTLAEGTNETFHYEIELSDKRNIIKALGLNEN
jgi:hypothetical protein